MGQSDLAVVLAAGQGTRMRSARPKVLHAVGNLPMIGHVLRAVDAAGLGRAAVVVGHGGAEVTAAVGRLSPEAACFVQDGQKGTAHAVLAARAAIGALPADAAVVVLYGDTPLVEARTVAHMAALVREGAAVAVLAFEATDPTGYGRLLMRDGRLAAIREERDATPDERAVRLCNSGIMALSAGTALSLLDAVGDGNANGEYYLTDVVAIAFGRDLPVAVAVADAGEVTGVNDRVQLAAAEAIFQARRRREAMLGGATLLAPDTVFFSYDTRLAEDVTVEPHVVFGPGVTVEAGATIHAFCHFEGAHIGRGAAVGPYARIRPTTRLGEKAKLGNFVEVKNAEIARGAKVNHLSYGGDSVGGEGANLGAGTITCNYDGTSKYVTRIGAGAFIGSNSALVAPVTIGDHAFVASGSVITEDVPDDALAIARGRQVVKPGRSRVRPGAEEG